MRRRQAAKRAQGDVTELERHERHLKRDRETRRQKAIAQPCESQSAFNRTRWRIRRQEEALEAIRSSIPQDHIGQIRDDTTEAASGAFEAEQSDTDIAANRHSRSLRRARDYIDSTDDEALVEAGSPTKILKREPGMGSPDAKDAVETTSVEIIDLVSDEEDEQELPSSRANHIKTEPNYLALVATRTSARPSVVPSEHSNEHVRPYPTDREFTAALAADAASTRPPIDSSRPLTSTTMRSEFLTDSQDEVEEQELHLQLKKKALERDMVDLELRLLRSRHKRAA